MAAGPAAPSWAGSASPSTVQWAAAELILGANPAVFLYLAGPRFAAIVHRLGTPEQQRLGRADDRARLGRDDGAHRARRRLGRRRRAARGPSRSPTAPGTSTGVKRFITSAEHDLDREHRAPRAGPPGGPGPRRAARHEGPVAFPRAEVPASTRRPATLGERNGVFATNVEHKMGLQGVGDVRARPSGSTASRRSGHLLGEVHDGIAQMFEVIEYARMMVGTKAIGTLSAGYRTALAYAKERVQGPDLTRVADKTRPPRDDHPPRGRAPDADAAEGVRRGLARALPLRGHAAGRRARRRTGRRDWPPRSTTCCCRSSRASAASGRRRCSCSRCRPSAARATCRTTRSSSTSATRRSTRLYEGTTAIQSLDLLLPQDRPGPRAGARARRRADRGVPRRGGRQRPAQGGARAARRRRSPTSAACSARSPATSPRPRREPARVHRAGQHSVRLLMALGDLLVGWLLLRRAQVALEVLDAGSRAGTGPSTRARWRSRGSSRPPGCRC